MTVHRKFTVTQTLDISLDVTDSDRLDSLSPKEDGEHLAGLMDEHLEIVLKAAAYEPGYVSHSLSTNVEAGDYVVDADEAKELSTDEEFKAALRALKALYGVVEVDYSATSSLLEQTRERFAIGDTVSVALDAAASSDSERGGVFFYPHGGEIIGTVMDIGEYEGAVSVIVKDSSGLHQHVNPADLIVLDDSEV